MLPVVGHLVGKAWATCLAMNARPLDIFLAKTQALGRAKRADQRGKIGKLAVVQTRLQPGCDHHHVRQFHRAFDLAVAGEDLLDQRRARTREANNEDRILGGATTLAHRGNERRGEGGDCRIDFGGELVRVIAHQGPAPAIALGVVRVGSRRVSGILEGLAQREMEVKHILLAPLLAFNFRKRGFHARDILA